MSSKRDFLNAGKVRTSHKIRCKGYLKKVEDEPVQRGYRFKREHAEWIDDNIPARHASFALAQMIECSLIKIKKQLADGDFNIDRMTDDC